MSTATLTLEYFVKAVSEKTNFSERSVRECLRAYHTALAEGLTTADKVRIEKVGTISARWRQARNCRRPGTESVAVVPARWALRFKAAEPAMRLVAAKRKKGGKK